MVKRTKRLERGIESLKEEVEKHFKKVEEDIMESNIDLGRYHLKEIDKSLLNALELRINLLGIRDNSPETFRKRLEKLKKRIEI